MRSEIKNFVGKSVVVEGRVSAISQHGVCIEQIKVNNEIEVDHSWIQHGDNVIGNVRRGDHIVGEFIVGEYFKRGGVRDFNFKGGVII